MLTLTLNIGFSNSGVLPTGFGALYYCDGSSDSLSGQTVSSVLAAANKAIGCGILPTGYSFGTLETLVDNLNGSFDNGLASSFALTDLSPTPCH